MSGNGVATVRRLGLMKRLLEKAHFPVRKGGCIEWKAAKDSYGYGRIIVSEKGKQKTLKAHRVAFELFLGPIGDNNLVCHRCDNPACINPDHLFKGSNSDNMNDSYRKGRSRYRPPKEKTPKFYNEIIESFVPYNITRKMLADKFYVSVKHVDYVLKRARKRGDITTWLLP